MATFADIGLSQPAASTITMKLRTLTLDQNSTTVHQEILSIGDTDSTAFVARVSTGVPSTHAGLITRSLVYQSSQADNRASVYQSTAGDLRATIYSPSTVADLTVRAMQSSAGDFRVTASQDATPWDFISGSTAAADYLPVRIVDSSGTGFAPIGLDYTNGSTVSTLAAPGLTYSNSSNDTMRIVGVTQPLPVQLRSGTLTLQSTTVVITSTNSTHRYEVLSSVASMKHKVYAYFVGSTHTNPSTLIFQSSGLGNNAGADKFGVNFGSGSSGMTGANLALTPPGFLFETATHEPLTVMVQGGSSAASTVTVRVSVSYFTEA